MSLVQIDISKDYLPIGFDHGLAVTGVNFVPAVGTQSDPLNNRKNKTLIIGTDELRDVFESNISMVNNYRTSVIPGKYATRNETKSPN